MLQSTSWYSPRYTGDSQKVTNFNPHRFILNPSEEKFPKIQTVPGTSDGHKDRGVLGVHILLRCSADME